MTLGELQELKVENNLAKKKLSGTVVDAQTSADELDRTVKIFKLRVNLEKRIEEVIKEKTDKS